MRVNKEVLDKEFTLIYSELTQITRGLIRRYGNKHEPSTILSETYLYLFENIEKIEKKENIKILKAKRGKDAKTA